jgi:predicted acyltransferase (DUF342 family)
MANNKTKLMNEASRHSSKRGQDQRANAKALIKLMQSANRINGQKSHGAVTEQGRASSARNSTRHGLLADTVVLEGESALVATMAAARWREMRLWSIEKAGLEREMINHTEGPRPQEQPRPSALYAIRPMSSNY